MGKRIVLKSILVAAVCVLALAPAATVAQQKAGAGKTAPVPEGGCAIANAALANGQTCADPCTAEQWCPVKWCVQGELQQTIFSCYEPTGLCAPKC